MIFRFRRLCINEILQSNFKFKLNPTVYYSTLNRILHIKYRGKCLNTALHKTVLVHDKKVSRRIYAGQYSIIYNLSVCGVSLKQ